MTAIDLTEEQSQAENGAYEEQSLYLKYRPYRFDDVLGQQNAVTGLKKRVAEGTVMSSHAYMFTGSRGCGKTTSARILAAAVNCERSTDGNPCGECDQCVAIMTGRSTGDVYELNAAENRGIDAMRAIIDTMPMGSPGRYKIYIFDEVHRLTADAASALLKPLEEPPSDNIIFILATTDPEQVLDTIRSRCTQVSFRDISDDDLLGLVRRISRGESMDLTEGQLLEAVAAGNGSARDAISALESVSLGMGFSVNETLHSLLDACIRRDISAGLLSIATADAEGSVNYRALVTKMFAFWRDAMIYSSNADLVPPKSEQVEELLERASKMGMVPISRNLNTLAGAIAQMKREGGHRILLEGAFTSMMVPASRSQWDAVVSDIEDLREEVSEGFASLRREIASSISRSAAGSDPWSASDSAFATQEQEGLSWPEAADPIPEGDDEDDSKEAPVVERAPAQTAESEPSAPSLDLDEFISRWDDLMEGYTTRWANSLRKAEVEHDDEGFIIVTKRPVLEKVQRRVLEDLALDVAVTFESE